MLLRRCLYTFLGAHSFLIGLFPFYIPVYLFSLGFSMTHISTFIALTGLGFCVTLYLYDRLYRHLSLRFLFIFSFLCEIALLTVLLSEITTITVLLAGVVNGAYNCYFWVIQRLLFLETVTPDNSGQKFGNFQIYVFIVLKSAIFLGGVLLENGGIIPIYCVSAVTAFIASSLFLSKSFGIEFSYRPHPNPLQLREIFTFRDQLRSVPIFIIDGLFLYLESYFWLISLYLLVDESFWKLGGLVVGLALLFGVIFILIKNRVDRIAREMFYRTCVVLYMFSWIMRAAIDDTFSLSILLILLASIALCTSLFRLAFNKRFFDNAQIGNGHTYIFMKSYYSQFFLVLFLLFPVYVLNGTATLATQLSHIYLIFAAISLLFFMYRAR